MPRTRQLTAIAMVAVMILASGCAGFGTNGPADGEADADDADDDPEGADGEAQADEGDSSDETDGVGADEHDADDRTTGDDESSDSGDSDDADANKTDGDQDEKTDETEGDSSDSDQDTDTDENGDSDSDVDDSGQEKARERDEDRDPQDGTHTLTVTVTDPDGEPVTDENGTVRFDLENGDYEVAVSAPDQDLHHPSDQRLVTIDGEDEEFSVQLRSPDGDETHTLTVTIIDQTAAGPMDGTATVDGETKDVVGDEGAEFEVDDGTYTVTGEASIDGWYVDSEEVTIDGGDKEVSLPANPIRTVTVDAAGVDVTLVDENGDEVKTKTTGDDGRVEFDASPGNYSLHVDGYESTDVTVPGAHDPETVEMSPEITHTLTINNAGTSTVEIEREARPGGGDGEDITAEPDENGVVEVDVEEGTYHVRTDDRNDTMVAIHVDEDTEITLQDPNADASHRLLTTSMMIMDRRRST